MSDALDIVERLRHFCTDWDGSSMSDHTEPMPGLHCVELREAADEIERLRAALTAPAVPAGWPWVSMKDRPPPPDCWLLVTWGDHNAVDKAHTYTKWKHKTNPLGYLIQGHHGSHNDVTAWMLLPTAAPQAPAP